MGVIKAKPGILLWEIKQLTGVHNGVAAHHLNILEREGVIKSQTSPLNSRSRQFFIKDAELEGPYYRFSNIQLEIVKILFDNPGLTSTEVTKMYRLLHGVEISPQRIDYNLQRLRRVDCLFKKRGQKNTMNWYVNNQKLPQFDIKEEDC